MQFDVAFADDGTDLMSMAIGVDTVFWLEVQGPLSLLPEFGVPLTDREDGWVCDETGAQFLWLHTGAYAPAGQLEIAIGGDRILGHITELGMSFDSERRLGCWVPCDAIPNRERKSNRKDGDYIARPCEASVGEDVRRSRCFDEEFESPQCAALKARLQ